MLMTFRQKISLQILLLIAMLFAITTNYNNVAILIVMCMLIGLIADFIKTERTVRTIIATLLFWLICSIIIFSWKRGALFSDFIYLEIFKIIIILSLCVIDKKSSHQNSIIGKLWIIGFFIYVGEIVINSTFGFKNLYFATTIISLLYIILKPILTKLSQ